MTRRNKWRIVGLMGVAFCAYTCYLGADESSDVGEPSDGIYRVKEPGGEWVVSIPCPAGYSGRGAAQWTQEASRPLVWWATVESKGGGTVGARERFEYANPQLRRAAPAQDD